MNDYSDLRNESEQVCGTDKNQTVSEVALQPDDEIIEMGEDFDLNDFQVVRREFFAHLREPSATFNNCKFYVNMACLSKLPNVNYVQVLVNQETKILALRPCKEGERDSFVWCGESKGRRRPRPITCKLFCAKIFTMMGWNPDHRYKLLGNVIHSKGEYLIAFDLTSTEVYQKPVADGIKAQPSRTPVFPSEWQNQFGLPFYEHRQSMQVNIFDGYAIYAIKDNAAENPHEETVDADDGLKGSAESSGGNQHE